MASIKSRYSLPLNIYIYISFLGYISSPSEFQFVFAHDRIQQAAYSMTDEATTKKYHYKIGIFQYLAAFDSRNVFEIDTRKGTQDRLSI